MTGGAAPSDDGATEPWGAGFRVKRYEYSINPWRIVTIDGTELSFAVPGTNRGAFRPASYPTKSAAVEALGDYAWALHQLQVDR